MKATFNRPITLSLTFSFLSGILVSFLPVTGTAGFSMPDVLVSKKSNSGFIGDGIYNTTGARQTVNRMTRGNAVKSFFKVQSDTGTIVINLRATKGNKKFRAKYFDTADNSNVTSAITKGTFVANVVTGTDLLFRQEVKPTGRTRGKKASKTFKFNALESGILLDTARAKVRKRR